MRIAVQCRGIVLLRMWQDRTEVSKGWEGSSDREKDEHDEHSTSGRRSEAVGKSTRMWSKEMQKHSLPTRPHVAFKACNHKWTKQAFHKKLSNSNRPCNQEMIAVRNGHQKSACKHSSLRWKCPWSKPTTKLLKDKQTHTSSQFSVQFQTHRPEKQQGVSKMVASRPPNSRNYLLNAVNTELALQKT